MGHENKLVSLYDYAHDTVLNIALDAVQLDELPDKPRYCYVLKNENNGLFKIGRTSDLFGRIRQINTQGGGGISLLFAAEIYTFNTSERVLESVLHCYYKNKKVIGEWFSLESKDIFDIYEFMNNSLIDDFIQTEDFDTQYDNIF